MATCNFQMCVCVCVCVCERCKIDSNCDSWIGQHFTCSFYFTLTRIERTTRPHTTRSLTACASITMLFYFRSIPRNLLFENIPIHLQARQAKLNMLQLTQTATARHDSSLRGSSGKQQHTCTLRAQPKR